MSTLSYVGRSPDSDGVIVSKGYVDTTNTAQALTSTWVNNQVSAAAALLTTQSYVDLQDATVAHKTAVTAADAVYVSAALRGAANGVAGLDSSGSLVSATIPSGVLTDRVMTAYSMSHSVAFEAIGTNAGSSGATSSGTPSTTTLTGHHTSAGGANTVVLAYVDLVPNGSAVGDPSASVTYGGVSMNLLPTPIIYQVPGTASAYGGVFYLFNPPPGAQPVVTTMSASGSISWFTNIQTISYTNVGSVGTLVKNQDFNQDTTTATLNSVPCSPGGLVSVCFAETSNAGGSQFTTSNQTIRYNNTAGGASGCYMLLAEAGASGASSYNFTATLASAVGWGALGVPLNPAVSGSQIGLLNFSGSVTVTGTTVQKLATMVIPDPGWPWRPIPLAWVAGDSSGSAKPATRSIGTGSYGVLTVVPPAGGQNYGLGLCTGSYATDMYPVIPYAAPNQTPTSVPPITGGLELDLCGQLWSGTTYTFYSANLQYLILVAPAL